MADCIVFSGGGTGGHVFPALAVLDELAPAWPGRLVWIGSASGIERSILSQRGIPFYGIPSGKLRRYFSLRNFLDLFKITAGFISALFILAKEKPRLVFSKGGYVSVPPVLAAWVLRIPALTHESDLNPGLATRINARFCKKVLVSFADTRQFFGASLQRKIMHTGNPIRRSLLRGDPAAGRALVGCPPGRKILLVLGGSLGSAFINKAVLSGLEELTRLCFVVHQMGSVHYRPSSRDDYYPAPFFTRELADLLAAADLVVCRAGANTLWELAALGRPAVLVPLAEYASRGDQIENAAFFARSGAAVVVPEAQAAEGRLTETVLQLVGNDSKLAEMGRRAAALGRPESAAMIAGLILERQ